MSQKISHESARVEETATTSVDDCVSACNDVLAAYFRLVDRLNQAGLSEDLLAEVDQLHDLIQEEVAEVEEQVMQQFEAKNAAAEFAALK